MGSESRRPGAPGRCQGRGCSAASLPRPAPAPAGCLPCGSSAVQGLWPDGGTAPSPHWGDNKWRSGKAHPEPASAPQSSSLPVSPAHHGGLEGRPGEGASCRLSLGSGSRRAPTVCATSWNTDLSRLSQSEGSLGESGQGSGSICARLRAGSPTPPSLHQGPPLTYLWVGPRAEPSGTQRGVPT